MIDVVKKYLTGVSLVALTFSLNSATAYAEGCPAVPTCAELGYSKTDCGGARALKCPFDQSKLFCSGNGGSSGNNSPTCNNGDIYYSDDTCSSDVVSGKTPIGVVFDRTMRLVVSLDEVEKTWGVFGTDIAQLTNYNDRTAVKSDVNGKSNTDILVSLVGGYPAAQYCHDMTTGGKTWYLPAVGEILPMCNNSAVQSTVSAVGTAFQDTLYWSSTEYNNYIAWFFDPVRDNSYYSNDKNTTYQVRCIFKYGE